MGSNPYSYFLPTKKTILLDGTCGSEDEGFDDQKGIDQFFELVDQTDHRTVWIWIGSNLYPNAKKSPTAKAVRRFLAEDEGFEPPQTESESGVLPLHKSSKSLDNLVSFVTGQKSFDHHQGS